MKRLYILDNTTQSQIEEMVIDDSSKFITFDFVSHENLLKKGIKHEIIDEFLTDDTRKEIFIFCSTWLKRHEEDNRSEFKIHDIDLTTIIDRNELLEFLMEKIPKTVAFFNIIKKLPNEKYVIVFSKYQEKLMRHCQY